ncbi:MAG: glycosyl hydrolase [Armatimonadota bacterium]
MNSQTLNDLSKKIDSPVPFWFLNGHMEEWHIVRELEMMRKKGITEVIVHPRYGLQTEYLSDAWFELFGWCLREAKRLGMYVWIYDELNWPSGTAGMTVQQDPNLQSKFLHVDVKPLSEIDLNSFVPGKYVVAANTEAGNVTKSRLISDVASLKGLMGNWQIYNCTMKRDPIYVDTLSFVAVDKFKSVTYDEYFNRFGDEFGKTIRAVFTDEPSIYWVSVGYDDWNLPYTDDFFETFEQRFGYSPAPMIPYLFHKGREGTAFRADYWDHAGFLFNQRYHGNLGKWCREHGVIYTGHNNNEEPLRYQIRFEGNMYDTMRTEDIPGVDHLGKQTLGNWYISIIGHKICSSEAHISGKARCMSESFGVMDWDTTYTNLKRVVDWQYALGINLMVPHALFHTISGTTKRESPPSFFYQSPHWDDFGCFTEYLRKLETMLCGGRHLCKVAVMYPLSGLWSSYQPDRKTSDFEHIDNFLNSLCLELIKNQIDFDLVDFKALLEAELQDGRLKLADEEYEALIVPSSAYMRASEVARLREIAASGVGTTFFHKAMEPQPQNVPNGTGKATYVRSEELVSFVEILRKELDDDIQITGGGADDIMAYRREKDGRKITFLLNRSEKHRKVMAMIKDYPNAAIFDQETGTYTKLIGKRAGTRTQVELRFQPNQSYFVVSDVPEAAEPCTSLGEPTPVEIKDLTVELPFNVASIYHFNYSGDGLLPVEMDIRTQPRFIPANWDTNPPDFDLHAGTYEATVDVNCDPSGISMIVDKDFMDCEVYLNGSRITYESCCNGSDEDFYLTDFQDIRASVDGLLRQGINHLKVISATKLSEPLRLVGNFKVHLATRDVVLNPPGETNIFRLEMDHPFYSGMVTYRAQFELAQKHSSLTLNLHEVRDAATVRVNGCEAGKRLWEPYTLDIAEFSHIGVNELEIEVRNNMANLIQGNPRSLGLQRMPVLAGFE